MTLQQLRYFCVMTEVLHYTKAANMLYVSQPSLSYSLSKLEEELGVPLFEKTGKQTRLTKFGTAFLPFAKNALNELSRGEALLMEMAGSVSGTISLGYIYSVGFELMPRVVERFFDHRGDREITFRFQQGMTRVLLDQLLEGSLDILLSAEPDTEGFDFIPIYHQEVFLAVHEKHPLAERKAVKLDDLAGEKLISINHNAILYRQLEERFRKHDMEPQIVFEVDECSSIAAFVAAGAGVAIIPHLPVADSYPIALLPFEEPKLQREIGLLKCKNRFMTPSVQCFWDYAKILGEEF